MNVHATKKLLSKLPLNENSRLSNHPPVAANDVPGLGDWHANLVLIQRRQCVVFVHDATRFTVFIPCLDKADLARLDWHFEDVFVNTLLKSDLAPELLDATTRLLTPLRFDNTCSRSVQSTMTQRVLDLEYSLEYQGEQITNVLPYSTSLRLSDTPSTMKGVKGHIWPVSAMHKLIESAVAP